MLQQDFNTALKLTQDEQYLDAIKIYEKILQAEPEHAPTHYNLGLLAAKTGDVKKARVHKRKFKQPPKQLSLEM